MVNYLVSCGYIRSHSPFYSQIVYLLSAVFCLTVLLTPVVSISSVGKEYR